MRRFSFVGLASTITLGTLATLAVACRDELKAPAEPGSGPASRAVAGPLPPPTIPYRPDRRANATRGAQFNKIGSANGSANLNVIGSSTSTIAIDGESQTWSTAINDGGQVTGYAFNLSANAYHAFVWSNADGGRDLGTLSGTDNSLGQAINASGTVAGYAYSSSTGVPHAFLASASGTMQDLGVLTASGSSMANGLNDAGQVVGSASTLDGRLHAFLWSASTGMVDITPSAAAAEAIGVSNDGVVSGRIQGDDGQFHVFQRTSAGVLTDLGTFGGDWAYAAASNAHGQVTGYIQNGSTYTGFLYTPGQPLQTFGTWTETIPEALNANGDVVGYVYDGDTGQRHPFLWNATDGLQDLDAFVDQVELLGVDDGLRGIYAGSLFTLHDNHPPVASDVTTQTVTNTPVAVTLVGSDPDSDPLTYAVPTPPRHGSLTGTAPNLTYTPAAGFEGQDSFTFTVSDPFGAVARATVSVTINPNHLPVAVPGGNDAAHGAYLGVEGGAVAFDGGASTDSDHDALIYAWNFGDGSAATTASGVATTSHVYADNGTFTAKLTVTDTHGAAATQTVSVVVANVSPTATLTAPATVNEGDSFTLAMTNVHDASAIDQQSLQFEYDCGSGFGAPTTDTSVRCSTVDNGARSAHVKVMDKDGGVMQYDADVIVQNVQPTVSVGSAVTITSGDTYKFNGSFTDPGVNDAPWSYVVSWGTGTSSSGSMPTRGAIAAGHQFLAAGTYTVALSVTDKDNGTGTAATTVTVLRLAVGLAIKPGDGTKPIKLNEMSNADIPIAILSSPSFNAHLVDVGSVRIGNAAVARKNNGTFMASYEDVNHDGRPDLVVHVRLSDLLSVGGLTWSSRSLTVLANLTDGRQITATDVVRPL
ncbi:MAG TPA: PKD domain-containing protein [Gemmatimonadaceae bacterium]|nr:PKD domain-containing protein [Gemmatimonadaceae bacterium]